MWGSIHGVRFGKTSSHVTRSSQPLGTSVCQELNCGAGTEEMEMEQRLGEALGAQKTAPQENPDKAVLPFGFALNS